MAEESRAASLFGSSLDTLTKALGGTAKTAIGLGGALLTGQQQLSAYSGALAENTEAFGRLGGALGKVVNGLTQFAEASLAEYQALTGIGATFGKEIKDIKVAAAELGMTVEEMTGFLKENAKGLRAFGGTTDEAMARFKALSNTVLDSAELGMELRRLGYTTKDINEGLALFGEISRANANQDRQTLAEQAVSAKALMVELDGLSKLTGKQRQELADEMRARRRQGDINAFLMGKNAEEQAAFTTQLTELQSKLGQDAADAFVDIALRGAPTTEGARNAMLAMGDGADELYNAAAQFNRGDIGAFQDSLRTATGLAVDFQNSEEFRNTAILGGVTGVSDAFAKASSAAIDYKNAIDATKYGTMTAQQAEKEIRDQIQQQQLTQMEQVTGVFDETMKVQENLRKLTSQVMEETIPHLENVAVAGLEKMQAAMPSAKEIADGITTGVNSLFNAADRTDALAEEVTTITPAIEQLGADVTSTLDETSSTIQQKVEDDTNVVSAEAQRRIDVAEENITNAQAQLAEAQQRLQESIESGVIPDIRDARIAAEAAKVAAEAAAREQAAATMSAVGVANIGGKMYADGGSIPSGDIGLVGESGPEFITGPANIMSAKTSMGVMQTLMKSIRTLDSNVQEVGSNMENGISTSSEPSMFSMESNKKLDTMIGLLGQLIQVENMAVGAQRQTMKATKGLTGNMLRGV